jgi:ubiquinone/menaquinone biosynthesis C-methylase UbiE
MSRAKKMKDHAHAEFHAWADTYDASLLNRFMFHPAYRLFIEEIYTWQANRTVPFDLLDIGCATGAFHRMLSACRLPARVWGVDYVPAMCRAASQKAQQAGVANRVRYVAGDSEHLPFADGSFDVVTCSNSFHHYPHQKRVVQDMRRVLRPGGRLIIIDGFRDNVIGWVVFDVIIGMIENGVHHAPWSTLREYLEQAGFTDIRRRKAGFWFPLLLTVGAA